MKKYFVLFAALLMVGAANVATAAVEYTSEAAVQANADDWADYQAQGEYLFQKGDMRFAVQVIARGAGKFELVGYPGGFPGEGWIAKKVKVFYSGTREGNVVTMPCTGFQMGAESENILPVPEGKVGSKAVLYIAEKRIDFVAPDGGTRSANKIDRPNSALGTAAPEGAFVVFDGKTINLKDGYRLNEEAGTVWSEFCSKPFEPNKAYRLHVEFQLSYMPYSSSQGRSNSGVYVAEAYECQVLDSFGLVGRNNECSGFYQQAAPLFNACRAPLTWQAYDIDYTPAQWDNGQKTANAHMTVYLNGLKVQDNVELKNQTPGRFGEPKADEARGVYCQGHGNKVQYRNIWVQYK